MIFKWDPAKAAKNKKKHRVDFHEAASVLEDPLSTTFPDPAHSRLERRLLTIGVSSTQRLLVVSHTEDGETVRIISARAANAESKDSMKKVRKATSETMLPEYDFASMKGGVRGKYIKRLRSGSNLVLLEPDLAAAFRTDAAVNRALRAALDAASAVTPGRLPNNAYLDSSRKASS